MADLQHPTAYEKRDIPVVKVAWYGLAGIVFLVVISLLGRSFFILSKERAYYHQVMQAPAPYLQQVQEAAADQLNSYGIVDAEKGIYRIPIESAMEKLATEAKQ